MGKSMTDRVMVNRPKFAKQHPQYPGVNSARAFPYPRPRTYDKVPTRPGDPNRISKKMSTVRPPAAMNPLTRLPKTPVSLAAAVRP